MAESSVTCDKDAVVIKCSGCGQLLNCCDEHKKTELSAHKAVCRPYRVEKNSKYGRFIVTSRDVKQGEILLRERPTIVGPRVDSLPACTECYTLLYAPLTRCPACRVSLLCPRCTHNTLDCQFYSSLSQASQDLCLRAGCQHILPLRILLRLRSPGFEQFKRVLDMESHIDKRKGTDVYFSHHKNVVELFQTCGVIGGDKQEVELVQQICGVLDVNSFEVRGAMGFSGMGMRLRGVYTEAALMAHDCVANVHLSVDDNFVMTIRASVDIPQGQPILYNYTDPLQTTCERQKHLREGKYFSCACQRCEDPTELHTYLGAVRCPACRKGFILANMVSQAWICEKCDHQYSPGLMSLTIQLARDRLESIDRSNPQQLEQTLKDLGYTFAPTHSVLLDIKQSIVAAYRDMEPTKQNLHRKVELCRELLPVLRVIEPGISRLRGITLYELHMGLVMLGQELSEVQYLREAEEVLREAVGLLLYEPTVSPEGELARQAISELKALKQIVAKHEVKEKKKNKTKHKK